MKSLTLNAKLEWIHILCLNSFPDIANCNILWICCQISFLLGQEKPWTNSIVILPKHAHLPLREINEQPVCLYRSASVCTSICHESLSNKSPDVADNTSNLISGIWKTGRSVGQQRGFKGLLSQQEVGWLGWWWCWVLCETGHQVQFAHSLLAQGTS